MKANCKTPCLAHTVNAAVSFFANRPDLCANPRSLMRSCEEWAVAMLREIDGDSSLVHVDPDMVACALHEAGLRAAQEVAMPCKSVNLDIINPEDLK